MDRRQPQKKGRGASGLPSGRRNASSRPSARSRLQSDPSTSSRGSSQVRAARSNRSARQAATRDVSSRANRDRKDAVRSKQAATRSNATRKASSQRGSHAANQSARRSSSRVTQNAPQYAMPGVWTKDQPRRSKSSTRSTSRASSSRTASSQLGSHGKRGISAVFSAIGNGLLFAFRAFLSLLIRSRVALTVFLLVFVVGLGLLVDYGVTNGKVYPGVRIGSIDVSGKTEQEITQLLQDNYQLRVNTVEVTIYGEATASPSSPAGDSSEPQNEESTQDASASSTDSAGSEAQSWSATANSLGAELPAEELAHQAFEVGRSNGGLPARISALFNGWEVSLGLAFDSDKVEALAEEIDNVIGEPREDYGVEIVEGSARVTTGHDGTMINRDTFKQQLNDAILFSEDPSVTAVAEYSAMRIDEAQAQAVCDEFNAVLSSGIEVNYQGNSWTFTAEDIATCLSTRVEQDGDGWTLTPYIDESQALPHIASLTRQSSEEKKAQISFTKNDDGSVTVHTDQTGTMPLISDAISALDQVLFSGQDSVDIAPSEEYGQSAGVTHAQRNADTGLVSVSIIQTVTPAEIDFDSAVALGVVDEISSYTTQYSTGTGTQNRVSNIHLVSDMLNNSIVANEGVWSFNQTTGERTESAGFLPAGTINNGEYVDDVAGGICQVATTVFNAVYDAGLPIVARTNHTLYIASYPDGRDAAVSWPDLDLKWGNDTGSDVLLRMTYDSSSVTASVYGIDPGYTVTTDVGEWEEGEEYETVTKVDESLAPGTSYTESAGSNGREISIVRSVTNANGTLIRQDRFDSVYQPKNEVIVQGPETNSSDNDESE